MKIDVASYNLSERAAMRSLSGDHIRTFSPVTFLSLGIPTQVEDEIALLGCVDALHERDRPVERHEQMDYSLDEADLVRRINEDVLNLTGNLFGRRIRPWMGPLVAMNMFRAISAIASAAKQKLRILEIGCGSGYLGTMLVKNGHHYIGSDVTQSFYLWQNRLFFHLAGEQFLEGANCAVFPYKQEARVIHIPWWHLATMYRHGIPDVDIMVCDHAFGEMPPFGLYYTIKLAVQALKRSPVGLLLFESIGEAHHASLADVVELLERSGLKQVLGKQIFAFGAANIQRPDIQFLEEKVPLFEPSARAARCRGADFIPISAEEAPIQYEFLAFMGFETPGRIFGG